LAFTKENRLRRSGFCGEQSVKTDKTAHSTCAGGDHV
jgi:hypothetical protein